MNNKIRYNGKLIKGVSVKPTPMTFEEFMNAEEGQRCTIESYIQGWSLLNQGDPEVTTVDLFLQDELGAYNVIGAKFNGKQNYLEKGAKVLVMGNKHTSGYRISLYPGKNLNMPKNVGYSPIFENINTDDTFIAQPEEVTDIIGTTDLYDYRYRNKYLNIKNVAIKKIDYQSLSVRPDSNDNIHIHLNVITEDGRDFGIYVNRWHNEHDIGDCYKIAWDLTVGDVIDVSGFLTGDWNDGGKLDEKVLMLYATQIVKK